MNTSARLVPDASFVGKTNGELLALAEERFDVFVTLDKGIEYQQNLTHRKIAILLIRVRSNRLTDLLPHVKQCLDALVGIKPGDVVKIGQGDSSSPY